MTEEIAKNSIVDSILDDIKRTEAFLSPSTEYELLKPKEEESLLSYLIRLAMIYGLSLQDYLISEKEFLMKNDNSYVKTPLRWGWIQNTDIFPHPLLKRILNNQSLKTEHLTILNQLKKIRIDINQLKTNRFKLSAHYHKDLRFCPICWQKKSQRYFKRTWRFSNVVICQEHDVYLVDRCESCKKPLFANPQYFVQKWFSECQNCGQKYLNFPYSEEDELIGKIQSLILESQYKNDISHFITRFLALTIPHKQLINFSQLLKQNIGYQGFIGLIIAILEVYSFYESEKRIPTTRDGFNGVGTALGRGEWVEYNISSWNDLLKLILNSVNVERGKYEGKDGLKTAIAMMKDFHKKYQKLPTNREQELLGIYGALYRGEWRELGYHSWNDLLIEVFDEINLKMNYYIGDQGLKRAIRLLNDLSQKNRKIPISTMSEVTGITTAISRNEWRNQGLKSWNDLLIKVFGKTNLDRNKYRDNISLQIIVKKLKDFRSQNNRLPTSSDKGMEKIETAARRNRFVKHGISSWNDLLFYTFGEINFVGKNAFIGEKGLFLAKHKLTTFFSDNQYQPSPSSKGMSGIATAVKNGNFSDYQINSWTDLLIHVFGKIKKRRRKKKKRNKKESIQEPHKNSFSINKKKCSKKVRVNKINTKKIFQESIEEIIQFKQANKRIPRTRDIGMNKIVHRIKSGYFREFGINFWNDLLKLAFNEVNHRKNVYTGENGLKRAIAELKVFKQTLKRLPIVNDKGVGGLLRAVKRGEWAEKDINTWNDLLRVTFGKVNLQRGKYNGKIGLERAKQELHDFSMKYKRLPKYKDIEVRGVIGAIQNKKWIKLGIGSWTDLLMSTFGELNCRK